MTENALQRMAFARSGQALNALALRRGEEARQNALMTHFAPQAPRPRGWLNALWGGVVDGASAGLEDYQAALTGYRVVPGAIETDAGPMIVNPDGSWSPATEREPDVFRALTLFGGAAPWGRGVGMAAKKGAEGVAVNAARHAAELPMDDASRMARAREMGYRVDDPVWRGNDGADSYESGAFFSRDREVAAGPKFNSAGPEPRQFVVKAERPYHFGRDLTARDVTDILDAIAADYGGAATEKFYKGAFSAVPGMPKTMADFRRLATEAPGTAIENAASMAQMLEMQFTGPTHSASAGIAPLLRRAGFDLIDTGRDIIKPNTGFGIREAGARFNPAAMDEKNIFAARISLPVTTNSDRPRE